MNYKIIALSDLSKNDFDRYLIMIKEIFFLSSSVQEFESQEVKKLFFDKWCGDYVTNYKSYFYLMINSQDDTLFGYLSGCPDSEESLKRMRVPGQKLFQDLHNEFPAHLHINFHPSSRGLGLGSILVDHFSRVLMDESGKGLHLVTSKNAKNITFYQKLGFSREVEREYYGSQLLFMGKTFM